MTVAHRVRGVAVEKTPMENVLIPYCRAIDFDPHTGVCSAPFYGPPPAGLPPLTAAEGLQLSSVIIGLWAIGFVIKQARRPVGG